MSTNEPLLSTHLARNESELRRALQDADDVVFRKFRLEEKHGSIDALLIYVEGLVENAWIGELVLEPLLESQADASKPRSFSRNIAVPDLDSLRGMPEVLSAIANGYCVILYDGSAAAMRADLRGGERRAIEEPQAETVVRGARDGFVESLRGNTALIRRRIKDPALKMKSLVVGRRTRTDVAVAYIEGLANVEIIEELIRRLKSIEIDDVLFSNTVQEFIQDRRVTPFPLVLATERPDRCSLAILEGRAVVIVDGTPFALIVPSILKDYFTTTEDYTTDVAVVTLLRVLRNAALTASVLLPGIYVSLVSFHPELIPTRLALTVAGTRLGIPFPAQIEMLLILIVAETILEAAIRLPRPIGQTIGIVGGIILGEAVVQAGVVSTIMVVVIALTLITSFATPSPQIVTPIRLLRYVFLLAASTFGLFGIILTGIVVLVHLLTLESFGIPYMSPLAPFHAREVALDGPIYRAPWRKQTRRPETFRPQDLQRQPASRFEADDASTQERRQ